MPLFPFLFPEGLQHLQPSPLGEEVAQVASEPCLGVVKAKKH